LGKDLATHEGFEIVISTGDKKSNAENAIAIRWSAWGERDSGLSNAIVPIRGGRYKELWL
jgi:hypothetical protein